MKINSLLLGNILALIILLVSCNKDESVLTTQEGRGYIEYQYQYTLNGAVKKAYYRVNLTEAAFALYDSAACYLPDTLKTQSPLIYPDSIAKQFRKVELIFFSKESNLDSLYNPLSQPVNSSMVQFTLADTLAKDTKPNRILDYSYPTNLLKYMNTVPNRKPTVLNWKAYMQRQLDTLSTPIVLKYKYQFSGQMSKSVNIAHFSNGQYQIIANGTAISTPPSAGTTAMTYSLLYTGYIRQLKNRTVSSILGQ